MRKKAVVFCGPTVSRIQVKSLIRATVRPPAAQGDIIRACHEGFSLIGLIDGYFNHVPAPWHKEILWAMTRGVYVFGAASMGALRAAELSDFGMIGVGQIFSDYLSGRLTDDDEVAIAHLDERRHFAAVSEAMVNIRATLKAAVREKIIRRTTAAALCAEGKKTFFPERTFPGLLSWGRQAFGGNSAAKELDNLERWLAKGMVNQKERDALDLLEVMRTCMRDNWSLPPVKFRFEKTNAWLSALEYAAPTSEPPAPDD